MDLSFITDAIVNILFLPLQLILAPVDALLAQIPGIGQIPAAISSMGNFIGSIPSTLVSLFGINPIIWNSLFLTFVLFIGLAPAIQGVKKIWAWVRP